jgi:hypothetical protein
MSYLVVVDVGIKNMGLLVHDLNTKRVCLWERVDITKGIKYVPSNNVSYIHTLIDKHAQYFANAHMVIVERQMRVNMRVTEAVFQSRFFDKCKVINAQSVKMHFSISMRNYKQNKKKAVEWLDCHWGTVLSKFVSNQTEIWPLWVAETKKDDLADSMIMMLCYLNTYSEIV